MKYLKKYESDNDEPKVGDYFIVTIFPKDYYSEEYINFLKEHIGRIIRIDKSYNVNNIAWILGKFLFTSDDSVQVKNSFNYVQSFDFKHITFSSNKEDLEAILQAKKYNL
jgi:hypothetical protein